MVVRATELLLNGHERRLPAGARERFRSLSGLETFIGFALGAAIFRTVFYGESCPEFIRQLRSDLEHMYCSERFSEEGVRDILIDDGRFGACLDAANCAFELFHSQIGIFASDDDPVLMGIESLGINQIIGPVEDWHVNDAMRQARLEAFDARLVGLRPVSRCGSYRHELNRGIPADHASPQI